MISNFAIAAALVLCSLHGIVYGSDELKRDAVERVVLAHDPAVFVATGALYLKQEALRSANQGRLSVDTEMSVDRIIEQSVRDTAWFRAAWSRIIDETLSAEEADEIATHFGTDVGRIQRQIVELAVNEMLMTSYSFTNRIDHRLPGSDREMGDLQHTVHDREGVQNARLASNPSAMKFASTGAGVKYMKALMTRGVGAISAHLEGVAEEIRRAVRVTPN